MADNLVKDSLLVQAAVTGALIDLHADPERLPWQLMPSRLPI
jgi:hypothetical protein